MAGRDACCALVGQGQATAVGGWVGYSDSAPQKRACEAVRATLIEDAADTWPWQVPEKPPAPVQTLAVPILSDPLYLLRTAVRFGPLNYALVSFAKGKLGGGRGTTLVFVFNAARVKQNKG